MSSKCRNFLRKINDFVISYRIDLEGKRIEEMFQSFRMQNNIVQGGKL
jgi:hypothetical protein